MLISAKAALAMVSFSSSTERATDPVVISPEIRADIFIPRFVPCRKALRPLFSVRALLPQELPREDFGRPLVEMPEVGWPDAALQGREDAVLEGDAGTDQGGAHLC